MFSTDSDFVNNKAVHFELNTEFLLCVLTLLYDILSLL